MTPSREQLLESIETAVASIAPVAPTRFEPDLSFAELGLDSLGKVELVAELERSYAVMVDDADYRLLQTPAAVADYLAGRLG